jgi:hypothetical protein
MRSASGFVTASAAARVHGFFGAIKFPGVVATNSAVP